jgi:3-oxoadipate enol-lactonase
MHEWLGDHANWEPTWPYLNVGRFSYFFVDLRGYGWSKEIPGIYSVLEAANDVLGVMDHHSCQRFHVVGHSMSAMVAQKLMLRVPARVKSIVAVCPVPASGFSPDKDALKSLQAVIDDDDAARKAILARGGSRYGDAWLNYKLGIARRASNKTAMHGYLQMFTKTNFAAEIHRAETPILAIVGNHDILFYREESVRKNFESLYPNFSLVVCEGAGHYPMLETPVFLGAQMEKFMSTLTS